MNLALTANAEAVHAQFKVNKSVAQEATPYAVMFEIVGESVDATWTLTPEKGSVTAENFATTVWAPLVDRIQTEYAKKPAYIVVEVVYTNTEGNFASQPVLFKWCPESGCAIKAKMMIGASYQAFKNKVNMLDKTAELSLFSQLDINKFADELKLKSWAAQ